MKLLNVEVVLNREKGIQEAESEQDILKELDDETESYAILSHRWGVEVTYEEMIGFMMMEERKRGEARKHYGYQKIMKSCEQAKEDGYKWLWIDTCCIDKRSSAELSEAINAMYRWYQNAQVCYAYLNDVDESVFPTEPDSSKFGQSNGWPEWFMRGWTLQELIAPKQVKFFNKDWVPIGNKQCLAPTLAGITGIPREVLTHGMIEQRLCVAQIMSWAAQRKTKRMEDRAYSLMGLFGVNMPMLYGEGKNAFRRLQLEIIKETSDHSIFAWGTVPWNSWMPRTGRVLAEDPRDFRGCGRMRKVAPNKFVDRLIKQYIGNPLRIDILENDARTRQRKLVALLDAAHSVQFRTFTVSNAGIQVWLPVVPLPDSPSHFRAILPCTRDGDLATIDLVSSGTNFDRIPGTDSAFTTHPEFKTLHLTHHQVVDEKRRKLILDDKHASYYGFTRCGTYPREFRGNAVTHSFLTDGLIVTVYANNDARSRFAVGLGHYLGQGWVHVVCDKHSSSQGEDWTDFGRRAYDRMWEGHAEHTHSMPKHEHVNRDDHFTKHAHLPQSIWAARVVWGRWEIDDFKVMVDVEQCPGCCDGPWKWTTTDNDCNDIGVPGLMKTVRGSYSLELDGWEARFDKCSGQRIALGDYGDYSDGVLIRTGNIFEDMRTFGMDPKDTTYSPVVSRVSGWELQMLDMRNQGNVAVARSAIGNRHLALRQPKGISLPANDSTVLLLKALAIRLAGKHLVTTVIQCSEFYEADEDGKRSGSGDDLVLDSAESSTETGILTPLYTIATPQVWRRHLACAQRRERFKSIREHFYALVNMRQLAGTEAHRESANKRERGGAIKFFSDLCGLKYLRNYVCSSFRCLVPLTPLMERRLAR
ncbi:heterokaryon incompatibility protein-domain-containing protein [Pisolithus marmoratus]|nr:heterokaryon incompatibility protein-domain-containing protein [Pisolithus marmoratus]